MKDDFHTISETAVGAELEARVVAWVLGEASAFEAAELERRCSEDPVLRDFERRIRDLHGLIGEDFAVKPEADWRLPEGKRSRITDLLGVDEAAEGLRREKTANYFARRILLAAAACVALTLVAWPVFMTQARKAVRADRASSEAMPSYSMAPAYVELSEKREKAADFEGFVNDGTPLASPAAKAKPPVVGRLFAGKDSQAVAGEADRIETRGRMGGTGGSPAGGALAKNADAARVFASRGSEAVAGSGLVQPVPPPARGPEEATAPFASGWRSGDGAITRNNIDAILVDPNWGGVSEPGSPAKASDAFAAPAEPTLPADVATGGLRRDLTSDAPAQTRSREVTGSEFSDLAGMSRLAEEVGDAGKFNTYTGYRFSLDEDRSGNALSLSGLAGKEMVRRQSAVVDSDRLRDEGREAYEKGDYKQAVEKFGEALGALPEAPMVEDRRANLAESFANGSAALGEQYRKVGKYDEARQAIEQALAHDPGNEYAKRLKDHFDDPLRTNPALTDEHTGNVDKVRRSLYVAEGSYNLGKFDEAKKAYEEVIRVDPYNEAARRGLERVAQARTDYYRAAYDHTRAELLARVDAAWELAIPKDQSASEDQLRAAVQEQEALVEGRRKALGKVIEEGSVLYMGLEKAAEAGGGEVAAKGARMLELERVRLESQIEALLKYDNESLMATASGLDLPDNVVRILYPEYLNAKRQLDKLRGDGLGGNHEAVIAQQKLLAGIKRDLDEGVGNLRETLKTQLAMLKEQQERLEQRNPEERKEVSGAYKEALEAFKMESEALERLREALIERTVRGQSERKNVIPQQETETSTEPFSTFSLHVSDASFRLAKAALERGERPAVESVRPEEFYNAFDYGDPAPADGEPVACAVEQVAHPVLPQRNLLRIGVKTGAQGRGASTPLNLTLLLDSSGSMEREDRRAGLALAVERLAGLLQEGDTITVASFARQPRLLADRLPGKDAAKLSGIVAGTPSEGGTNLEEGLKLAGELALRQFQAGAQNRIVLFTDGAANLGDAEPESLQAMIEGFRQQGIAFDAAGFGADGLNDRLLERLTRNGNGRYYVVDRPEDADGQFAKKLAGAFRPAAENVKVQVRFNPTRVARYRLIGFEEHRLEKEDFRDDAVDAAEMAAEEAGNALYQIETLPQGEGEVGEVSVRFRDAASGEMVERSWTIPYEERVAGFDEARPSLQLAGLAAFVAGKLRGEPLADAVDFQELAPVMAKVKARYSHSRPVVELEEMIGRLR